MEADRKTNLLRLFEPYYLKPSECKYKYVKQAHSAGKVLYAPAERSGSQQS